METGLQRAGMISCIGLIVTVHSILLPCMINSYNLLTTCIGNEVFRSSDELVVAVSSTISVLFVTSILALIAGFACGYYFRGRKCKELSMKTVSQDNPVSVIAHQPTTGPLYEDVDVLQSAVEHQEQGVELKENVAYSPSKSMLSTGVEQKQK